MDKGKRFDNVPPELAESKDGLFGGEKGLRRINALLDHLEGELMPCPFCGCKAVINGMLTTANAGVTVCCPICGGRTAMLYPSLHESPRSVLLEKCAIDAAILWNKRTEAPA